MTNHKDRLVNDGYTVFKNAIPHHVIDRCLRAQRGARHNPLLIFRGQGVVGYERARWNAQSQMIRSIQNPHLLGLAPYLSNSIQELVFSTYIADALSESSENDRWVNWQTMLFDRSVGTDIHLDTWFLDTNPKGFLIGLWIALEDINADSGPFVVYPGSHKLQVSRRLKNLSDLNRKRNQLLGALEANGVKPVQLLLKKGDLVLWNSLLAHGSELPSSEHETRKSVTAHFYPYGMHVNEPPIKRLFSIYDHKSPQEVLPLKIYKAATVNPLIYSLICIAMYAVQAFRRKSFASGSIRRA